MTSEIPNAEALADKIWLDRVLAHLPPLAPRPGFQAALLAAFDAYHAKRLRTRLAAFAEMVWPGAPGWAPVSALALALLIGLGAGAALPDRTMGQVFAQDDHALSLGLDAPPQFDLEEDL